MDNYLLIPSVSIDYYIVPLGIVLLIFFYNPRVVYEDYRKGKIIESKAQVKPFVDIVHYQNQLKYMYQRYSVYP